MARRRGIVSYSDLVTSVPYFSGPDSHALAHMLGEINGVEAAYNGRALFISAVVTHKHDAYLGVGFFTAASELGLEVPGGDAERRAFWAVELERVHEAYGRGGDR